MPKKEELEKYLKEEIHPIFEALITELLLKVPRGHDVIPFCIEWLGRKVTKPESHKTLHESDPEDADEEEQRRFHEKMAKKKVSKTAKTRAAISAEVYGEYNKKEDFKPRVIPKSEQVKHRIVTRLKQSFIFANLDDKETDIVIDAMEEREFSKGVNVIVQGADGDCMFIVDLGELDCYKQFAPN